jgi:hypothetical protein
MQLTNSNVTGIVGFWPFSDGRATFPIPSEAVIRYQGSIWWSVREVRSAAYVHKPLTFREVLIF